MEENKGKSKSWGRGKERGKIGGKEIKKGMWGGGFKRRKKEGNVKVIMKDGGKEEKGERQREGKILGSWKERGRERGKGK